MIRLSTYWRSSCSWRVRIALNLKGVTVEHLPVHLVKDGGQQNAPGYAAKNPMRTVPMIEWDEDGQPRRLAQSMAIIEFLEERYPAPSLLPREPYARAQARMLAEIVNSGIQPLQNLAVLQHVKNELKGDDRAWCQHWITRGLTALEAEMKSTAGRYAVGDQVSVADLCLVPQLYGARRFGVELARFPTLLRVEQACEQLEAFQQAHPDRQPDAQPA